VDLDSLGSAGSSGSLGSLGRRIFLERHTKVAGIAMPGFVALRTGTALILQVLL
jgi:hypothetical protein